MSPRPLEAPFRPGLGLAWPVTTSAKRKLKLVTWVHVVPSVEM